MRILVTGSSGFIGKHLVPELSRKDNEVIALTRGRAPAGKAEVAGPVDLSEIEAWENWPQRIEAVVHLAALNPGRNDPQASGFSALHRANVQSTAALARRVAREGVARMVFISSANVHRPSDGEGVSESSPLDPLSPYAISKKEAEEVFWNALAGSATTGCVLRPAPVYGAGCRGNLQSLVKLARLPIPLPLEGLGGPRSLIAVDGLVAVISRALEAPAAAGETFLVADDGPLSIAEIVAALRQGWGRRALLFAAPATPITWLANATGKPAFWQALSASFIVNNRHLKERLGWHPDKDTAASLNEMAARAIL